MSKPKPSTKTVRYLYQLTGGRCYMCNEPVYEVNTDDSISYYGHIAHIESTSVDGPRYNPSLSIPDSNKPDNLMLLCRNHHGLIDEKNKELEFPLDRVRRIKEESIQRYNSLLSGHIVELGYNELRIIGDQLLTSEDTNESSETEISMVTVSIKDKIKKNELSPEVTQKIQQSLMKVQMVKKFLNENPDLVSVDKLRKIFVKNYRRLRRDGLKGDDLFYQLWEHVCGYRLEDSLQAGGLVMLVYFFELCEVLDK